MMPATVNVNRLAIHMPNLKVGSLYSLAGFDVTQCNQNYRLSDSSMMIRFSDSTCFDEITEPAIPIGVESFRFASCSVLPTQTLSFQVLLFLSVNLSILFSYLIIIIPQTLSVR